MPTTFEPTTTLKDDHNVDIKTLCSLLSQYMDSAQVEVVYDAYLLAADAHSGQYRMSGEAYIYHPLSVALILADIKMDSATIAAALLHDVIEDCDVTKEDLAKQFGETVGELVDGVSKLDKINFESKEEAAAASFRKMMLAMVSDIRVILIKLADRLHNMRTLNVMRPEKRRRIAKETLEVYAPIAMRLGINALRIELEDLGFQAMHPMRYRVLKSYVERTRKKRRELMTTVEIKLQAELDELGIQAKIQAREKHLYSLYKKMYRKKVGVKDIWDLFALRVILDSVDDCYRVLGVAHRVYKPLPNRFKDYIAIPKNNGYQGLHTLLFGPNGIPIEIQIRTEEMHRFAESGIAAHWIYKSEDSPHQNAKSRAQNWLQDLAHLQQHAGDPVEFLESVKMDLFSNDIFVFTPKGKILELPKSATVVDFAYALHTDIGNHCMGAKVNRNPVPLSTKLASGQKVEILTKEEAIPNPAWLNFVVSAKARSGIRHRLKQMTEMDSESLGTRLLSQALRAYEMNLNDVPEKTWDLIVDEYEYSDKAELMRQIGFGNRVPSLVARRIAPGISEPTPSGDATTPRSVNQLDIKGTEGLVITYSKCCHPIPGDKIVALITAGKGLVVHRRNCTNIPELGKREYAFLDVSWDDNINTMLPVPIRIDCKDDRGLMAKISTAIADVGCNIEYIDFEDRDGHNTILTFYITVSGRKMLADVIKKLRKIENTIKIRRKKG